MLLFLYILFVIGSGIYFFLTWNYKHWEKRGIPSPEPKILCGNLQGAVFGKKHVVYDFDRIYKNYKNQYSFVGVYSLRQPQYLITDARTAKDILITKFKSFHDNEVADMSDKKKDPILVSHPFMVKGEEWKEKRNEMTPAFTRLRIKAMYSIFQETAEHLKMALLRANGGTIDGYETCAHYAIDVVSNCIFGRDAGALSNGKSKILDMGRQFVFSTRFLLYFMAVQFLPSLKKIYKFSAVGKDVEAFFLNVMKDAIALRLKNQNKRKDHLNYLLDLRAKKNLSDFDMVAHVVLFIVDGIDQTGTVLTLILYQLGKNREIQNKLRKEIRETIEQHEEITFDVVQEMPYLEQVVSETLRLHPPAVFLSKICTETCELPLNNSKMGTFEEGYSVIIPIYSIHRDPRYYEDPDKFIPERFAPEKGGTKVYRDKGAFIPFGDGPRMCIGMKFSEAMLKAAIFAVVKDLEIDVDPTTSDTLELNPVEIIPTVLGGIWLKFKEIKK